jgi:hypothetical protein
LSYELDGGVEQSFNWWATSSDWVGRGDALLAIYDDGRRFVDDARGSGRLTVVMPGEPADWQAEFALEGIEWAAALLRFGCVWSGERRERGGIVGQPL